MLTMWYNSLSSKIAVRAALTANRPSVWEYTSMSNDTVEIKLTKGYTTIIDNCDADLAQFKWFATGGKGRIYAARAIRVENVRKRIYLHRTILERKIGKELGSLEHCDHIDTNGLNNCRSNLRLATNSQNQANSSLRVDNTSGYKGVYFDKKQGLWRAHITINGRNKHLGYFNTPKEAYKVYCEAAIKYHGEFARLK